MKICAACRTDLPKDSYSKKQWKLDKCQRRCKVCITDNREVQPASKQDKDTNTTEVIKLLDSMYLASVAEDKISDEELFKQPPPIEDCPICFLQMPSFTTGSKYQPCCGKSICSGCIHAVFTRVQGISACPFCRVPRHKDNEEAKEREKKLVEASNANAMNSIGCFYRDGTNGYPQDHSKALELFYRSAELGYSKAYGCIAFAYDAGEGVEVDKKKARHYYELTAIGGDVEARFNLGYDELQAGLEEVNKGNIDRAVKHFLIAVGGGCAKSLEKIKDLYKYELATKDDYTKALRSYQAYLSEIKSRQRDEAAAANKDYRYY